MMPNRTSYPCTRLARSQLGRVSSAISGGIMPSWASFPTLAVDIMPVRASYPVLIWHHANSGELPRADLARCQAGRVVPRGYGIMPARTSSPPTPFGNEPNDHVGYNRLQQRPKEVCHADEFPRCNLASSQFGRVALAEDLASCQVRRVARRLLGIVPIFFARKFTPFFVVFKGVSRCF